MTDPGIQAGVNVETISNQSGDTLLLGDDEARIANSYADVIRNRETATPVLTTPGSQTDGTYHGRGRRLTDLERNHFHEDNITPGPPCTAYFTASYFVDSQAVFDKLAELDIPRESVLCLQQRPSRDMLITFVDMETKLKFVNNVVIHLPNSSGVINDDDSPLTFLNIYDAPHELSNEALEVRLEKYCTVIASRRGKLPKSSVFNGIRHFRVRLKEPLPSYLRFGKFLVRLSHDGQQHTCRRCNRAGHFANECQNTVCFNCDELGHQSRECGEPVRCCICKSEAHMARRCPFSWYQRANPPAPEPNPTGPDPNLTNNISASGGPADPSSGGDVAAPAGDLSHPSDRSDFFRDILSAEVLANNDLLVAALLTSARGSPSSFAQSPEESSGPGVLDSQGFVREQPVSRDAVVPNPPGPQSSVGQDSMETDNLSTAPSDPPVISPADPPDDPLDPPDPPAGQPADTPADPPVDPSANPPTDSSKNPPATPTDRSVSSPTPSSSGRVRSSPAFSRRKPAPMPPALEALSRRPTRPTPPGKSIEVEEMQTQSSLKRKPITARKVADSKKGKH